MSFVVAEGLFVWFTSMIFTMSLHPSGVPRTSPEHHAIAISYIFREYSSNNTLLGNISTQDGAIIQSAVESADSYMLYIISQYELTPEAGLSTRYLYDLRLQMFRVASISVEMVSL